MKRPSLLADCLSPEEIQILVAAYGAGQRLFVPRSTAHAEHFEILLGLPATSRLIEGLFGSYVYLPGLPPRTGHTREPSLALVKSLSERMSAAEIARKYRVSVRCIYHKRREIKRRERLGLSLTASAGSQKRLTPKKSRPREGRHNGNRSLDRVSLRRSAGQELIDR